MGRSRRRDDGGTDDGAADGRVRRTPPGAVERWLVRLARLGYVARGALYLVIGGTAILLAVGLAEGASGSADALRLLARLPLGRVLLFTLAVGFVGYAALSLVAAVRAPEGGPADGGGRDGARAGAPGRWSARLARVADGIAGFVYAGLAVLALRILADPTFEHSGLAGTVWASRVLSFPGGAALLLGGGLATLGAALHLAVRAAGPRLADRLERRGLPTARRRAIVALARVGLAARALLFGTAGALAVRAAWLRDPTVVGGLGDALEVLDDTRGGPVVVALAGAGCVAYGLYQLAKSRYRRLRFTDAAAAVAGARRAPAPDAAPRRARRPSDAACPPAAMR